VSRNVELSRYAEWGSGGLEVLERGRFSEILWDL